MDWKPYYRAEVEDPGNRAKIDAWLNESAEIDLADRLAEGQILSFPHTALRYAGPLQSRVINALYEAEVDRVVALGVLHGIGPTLAAAGDESKALATRRAMSERVNGAFLLPQSVMETPFGPVVLESPILGASDPIRLDRAAVLQDEFSLDTFFTLLRRAADLRGVRSPLVLPVYIGLTRDPFDGSYDVADRLAAFLSAMLDRRTAIVATGDLVHYGTFYGSLVGSDGVPTQPDAMTTHFRDEVDRMFDHAWREDGRDEAYDRALRRLGNDQREMLAMILRLYDGCAAHEILSFDLSDYAEILDASPPCRVASSLVAYHSRSA